MSRKKAATGTARRPPRRSARGPLVGLVLVLCGLGAGCRGRSAEGSLAEAPERPAIPQPVETLAEDGSRVARLDVAAMAEWCASRDLPAPPAIARAEPAVAATLVEALERAAKGRSASDLGRVGKISAALDAHQSAISYFELAERADPADFRWPYYLGCSQQVTGRSEAASASFERVLRLQPELAMAHARLAQLLVEAGEPQAAATHWSRYNALAPSDWLGHVGLARIALDEGRVEEALEHLARARVHGEQDFQVQHALGRAHAAHGDEELARRHFALAAELPQGAWYRMRDPLDQELHAIIESADQLAAEFEASAGTADPESLLVLAREILARRPGDVGMRANIAELLRRLGRYEEAHAELDAVLDERPDSVRHLLVRSSLHLVEGQPERCLDDARHVLRLEPESALAHSLAARADYTLGNAERAIAGLRRAIELGGGVADVVTLGDLLREAGREDEARAAYRQAAALAPRSAAIQRRLQELGGD